MTLPESGRCESCGRATDEPHAVTCPGVPIFCPLCERDVGPVWPRIPNGTLPAVEHRPDGTHLFDWRDGSRLPDDPEFCIDPDDDSY